MKLTNNVCKCAMCVLGYWHRNGDPRYALPPDYVPPPTSSTPPPPPSSARNDFLLPPAPPGSNPGNDFAPGDDDDNEPVFDNSLVTNVTAQLGGNAHLQCKVLNIRNNNPVIKIKRKKERKNKLTLFLSLYTAEMGTEGVLGGIPTLNPSTFGLTPQCHKNI